MKRFQSGGLSVFGPDNVPAPEVGSISPSEEFDVPALPVIDVPTWSNMAIDATARQRQIEADRLRQQAQLSQSQKEYYGLRDELFGELHNPYQKRVVDEAKKKYGISDDMYASMNPNNYFQLKQETDKLYKVLHDPKVIRVLGEVEAANALMDKLPTNLTPEEFEQYTAVKDGYFNSSDGKYDLRALDGRAYKRPAVVTQQESAAKQKDLSTVTHRFVVNNALAVDWNNEDEVGRFADLMALNWHSASSTTAEELGYIEYDAFGNPRATDLGRQMAVEQGRFASEAYQTKREDKVEDAWRRPRSTPESREGERKTKEDQSIATAWETIVSWFPEFVDVNPLEHPEVRNVIAAWADSQGSVNELVKPVDRIKAQMNIRDAVRKALGTTPTAPTASQSTGTSTTPKLGGDLRRAETKPGGKVRWIGGKRYLEYPDGTRVLAPK